MQDIRRSFAQFLDFLMHSFLNRRQALDRWELAEQIIAAIEHSPDLDAALKFIAPKLRSATSSDRCLIFLQKGEGAQLVADPPISEKVESLPDFTSAHNITSESDPMALWLKRLCEQTNDANAKSALIADLGPKAIGAIICLRRSKWSHQDKCLVRSVASSLAAAIYQAQVSERELLTCALLPSISTAADVGDVLKVALERTRQALGATRASLFALSGEIPKCYAGQMDSAPLSALDLDGALLAQLLAGQMVIIPDVNLSDPQTSTIAVRQISVTHCGARALILAPVAYGNQTKAVFALEQADRPRQFSEREIQIVKSVADQIAIALYQAELRRHIQKAEACQALISKIRSAMQAQMDRDAVLQAIVDELGAALSVCTCYIALLADSEQLATTYQYLAPCCSQQNTGEAAMLFKLLLSTEKPLAIDDVDAEPELAPLKEHFESLGVKSLIAAKIWSAGRPVGVIAAYDRERKHAWSQWELDAIELVAQQAAIAIRQAELYQEAKESATSAALVNQIVASIRRSLDLEEILQATVEELGRALRANRINFRKLVGHQLIVVAEYLSDPSLSLRDIPVEISDYKMKYLIDTYRTLVIDDTRTLSSAHPDWAETEAAPASLSEIICPIFVNGKFWGALSINQTDSVRKWTASEIALVEAVTAQLEVAVSQSCLFEEAMQSACRQALISQITHGINQSNRLDEIFPIVARELGEHLAADTVAIIRRDEQAAEWRVECVYDEGRIHSPSRTHQTEDLPCLASMTGHGVLLCNDLFEDARFAPYLGHRIELPGMRALLAVPIQHNGSALIVIAALMKTEPRAWTEEEVEIVRAAADQVLIALQRAELFEQVSRGKHEWEATFDALSDGIFIFDRSGILRRANRAAASLEGAPVSELIGRRCCALLQGIEDDTCRVIPVIESGKPVTFELISERVKRPLLITISPIANGTDAALGAVCIVRDLSELRAAEAAAREQRSFLIKLIEHARDGIFALSPKGRFIWFNEQLVDFFGYSREELFASDIRRFLPEGERQMAIERFTRALSGEPQTFEVHALRRNGEARLFLVTYTPIYDAGRVTSVLAIARDITEDRMNAERAAQAEKLRALGQLASGVAHNFNNILTAILGHAQLMKRDLKQEHLIRRLEIIERAALDGAKTVKRIQGFALQQNETAYEPVDVNQLVQDSANLTRARWYDEAQASGLHYDVELKLQPVPCVLGLASELCEVFVNIILNALDAMPQGGRLVITTETKGKFVQISFADSGIGMSREVRRRIFEPFFTTKGTNGMGLGLAVSYGTIERHGGRIEVRSAVGRGSTFIISLPIAETARRQTGKTTPTGVRALNILVVDDDELVREAIAGMLASAGHHVVQASDGREALAKLERNHFDLVVTDLAMPEMDGWALASEVRDRWPSIRIVLTTGHTLPQEKMNQDRNLVDAIIYKPIRLDDLTSSLARALS
jgi:PAS domain S-box-containing protein